MQTLIDVTALTFVDEFLIMAKTHAEKSILFEGDIAITYAELDKKSDSLAMILQDQGIKEQDFVGVFLPQCADHIIAILAIFKIRAIYVPLDMAYTKNRLEYIINDIPLRYIISHSFERYQSQRSIQYIFLDREVGQILLSRRFVYSGGLLNDVAYIIYTSGSEGLPKGVVIKQQGIVNLAKAQISAFQIDESSKIFQYASMNFDASVAEWATALLSGAGLCFPMKPEDKMADALVNCCNNYGITIITLPPSLLLWLPLTEFRQLKTIILAGEAITTNLICRVPKSISVYNAYGPTEATVCATYAKLDDTIPPSCIGDEMTNIMVYLLDEHKNPVKQGEIGQMYITGIGLAEGYLHDPQLTQEKFIHNHFSESNNEYTRKMFATGDYARKLSNGKFEFVGRKDYQIKLHGYRINLIEVQSKITDSGLVKDALVKRIEIHSDPALCGYIIINDTTDDLSIETKLKTYLKEHLPHYMIPKYFFFLKSWTYNDNGKIDLTKLPIPNPQNSQITALSDTKDIVRSLWSTVLNITEENIFPYSNFFELGADSISAMRLRLLAKQNGLKLTTKQIYDYPCLYDMLQIIQNNFPNHILDSQHQIIKPKNLSAIQKWFFENGFSEPNHWNQWVIFEVNKLVKLQSILDVICIIVNKYDVFSYSFQEDSLETGNFILSKNTNPPKLEEYFDHCTLNCHDKGAYQSKLNDIVSRNQASLNLKIGRLFKISFIESNFTNSLVFIMHHLIVDAVSWHIINADLNFYITNIVSGTPTPPAQTATTFLSWIDRCHSLVNDTLFSTDTVYWRNFSQNLKNKKVLRSHATRSSKIVRQRKEIHLTKSKNIEFITNIYPVLISALSISSDILGDSDGIYMMLESHGRNIIDDSNASELIGWCTALYPIYIQKNETSHKKAIDILLFVKEHLDSIPRDGSGYGILRYLHPNDVIKSEFSKDPLPLICFNYLGRWDEKKSSQLINYSQEGIQFSSAERNHQVHAIEVNAILQSDTVILNIAYDLNQISTESIDLLFHNMQSFILDLELEVIKNNMPRLETLSYPLTALQHSLYFYETNKKDRDLKNSDYIVQFVLTLSGNVDGHKLRSSWDALQNHTLAFHTIFKKDSINGPRAYITDNTELNWNEIYCPSNHSINKRIETTLDQHTAEGFNISQPPLFKLTLLRTDNQRHYLVWSIHHIISDGWCTHLILNRLLTLYNNSSGENIHSWEIQDKLNISNYFKWINSQDKIIALKYWQNLLEHASSTLFTDFHSQTHSCINRDAGEKNNNVKDVSLSLDILTQIKTIASHHKTTLATLFQFAWSIICSLYTSKKDVTFGYVIGNRHFSINAIEEIISAISQTIPVRVNLIESYTISEAIQGIHIQNCHSANYSFCSLADIFSQNDREQTILFDSLLVIQNYPQLKKSDNLNSSLCIEDIQCYEKTEYPITCTVLLTDEINVKLTLNNPALSDTLIQQIAIDFEIILQSLINKSDLNISELNSAVRIRYLHKILCFNDTRRHFTSIKNLYELFYVTAITYKDNIALKEGNFNVRYSKLLDYINETSDSISKSKQPGSVSVAILLPRSIECIVAILAVLKEGLAYMPIDSDYPIKRISTMIKHAGVNLVITNDALLPKLENDLDTILLSKERLASITAMRTQPNQPDDYTDIANILYTSGSTNSPKGVMTTHKGMINRILWMSSHFNITNKDKVLHKTSVSFDVSGWEIFLPLLVGGECHVLPQPDHNDPQKITEIIESEKITCVHFVPSMLSAWINSIDNTRCNSLAHVFSSGEMLNEKTIHEFYSHSSANLYNLYGPTEASIDVTSWDCSNLNDRTLIGKPIANTSIYILDDNHEVVPENVKGEIYIGGVGVAAGYLNEPLLTKSCFLLIDINGTTERLYRTGDYGRILSCGNIEYLGRLDDQVKIRGNRIELPEIERIILMFEGIKNVVAVITNRITYKVLIAYVELDIDIQPTWEESLRKHIMKYLPSYMLPTYIFPISEIPKNSSGKVNRRLLAEKDLPNLTNNLSLPDTNSYTPIQANILSIISRTLNIDRIDFNDNFYRLGGDSITAIIIANNLRKLGLNLTINDILSGETLDESFKKAELFNREVKSTFTMKSNSNNLQHNLNYPIVFPLTNSQLGILFHSLKSQGNYSSSYIIHHIYSINGPLEIKKLEAAAECLMLMYPALSATFHWHNLMVPEQHIEKPPCIPISLIDPLSHDDLIERWKSNCQLTLSNLSIAPLNKMALIKDGFEKHILVWSHNHILFDGWSFHILFSMLIELYSEKIDIQSKLHQQLQGLDSYFSYHQESNKNQSTLFWKSYVNSIKLKTLFKPDTQNKQPHKEHHVYLNEKLINDSLSLTKRMAVTLNTLFLFCWGKTLQSYFNIEEIFVGLVLSGRNIDLPHIDELVGSFTHTVPFLLASDSNSTIEQGLQACQKSLHKISALPPLDLGEILSYRSDKNVVFETLYVYQNYPSNKTNLISKNISIECLSICENNEYPLTLTIIPDKAFQIRISYDSSIISHIHVEELTMCYINTLQKLLSNSRDKEISDDIRI